MPVKYKGRVKKQEQRPNVVIDISEFIELQEGEESATLTFREPTIKEIMMDDARIQRLKIDFPTLPPDTLRLCVILAACHVPETPTDRAAPSDFAEWSIDNKELYLAISADFGRAYPMDVLNKVELLKNG